MKENLAQAVNDKSRKITLRGKTAIVPMKFDEEGNPATIDTAIFKRLSLNDLRFLKILREKSWDVSAACESAGIARDAAIRLVKKLQCFRDEDAKVRALCEIPTPDWIASKHVENVYSPTLDDTQQKSLAELAKIEGAYKQTAPQTQINVFNLPELPADKQAEAKKFFDTLAEEVHVAQ